MVGFAVSCWALASSAVAHATFFMPATTTQLVANIATANANAQDDVIDLGGTTFSLTGVQNLTDGENGLPSITESGFTLTIQNGTLGRSGGTALRLLHVGATGTLILKNVTLSNGLAQEIGNGVASGGAIFSRGTLASIDGCTFSNNVASGANGSSLAAASGRGGAIYVASGTLTEIKASRFEANVARGGDAVAAVVAKAGDGLGGALHFVASSSVGQISTTTFSANQATGGKATAGTPLGGAGGSGRGGAIYAAAIAWTGLGDSSFENNLAAGGNGVVGSFSSFAAGDGSAGAIELAGATLSDLHGTTFSANQASGGSSAVSLMSSAGGGSAVGGAFHLSGASTIGTLTLSVFDGNLATGGVPASNGIQSAAGGGSAGGALVLDATSAIVQLATSTFSNNTAAGADAGVAGGAIHNAGTLRLVESTLSTNKAGEGNLTCTFAPNSGHGGAIFNPGTLTLVNDTFSGNAAGSGGLFCAQQAGGDGGAIHNFGTLTMTHATVSGNSAGLALASGGGIFNGGSVTGGTATVKNSIVAFNSASGTPGNCGGPITNGGNNLANDASCGFGAGNGVDPLLVAIANNGGPTQTMALQANSPAIDAVPDGACTDLAGNPVATDQRGIARPQDGPDADTKPRCDIGAFELVLLCADPYQPLSPTRILDTRSGTGAPAGSVGPGLEISLGVFGVGGVPAAGVSAVVLNVTAANATGNGNLRVYPSDAATPIASNLNFRAGENTPNLVIAKLGSDGGVKIFNGSGGAAVHVVGDVQGYFVDPSVSYKPITPVRILDTRLAIGAIAPGATIMLQVQGVGGVPSTGVSAVALNLTAASGTADGELSVFPSDGSDPAPIRNLSFRANTNRANLVIAKVGSDGAIQIHNASAGTVHAVVDSQGYFSSETSCYGPVSPVRVLNTQDGTGGTMGPIGPGQTIALTVVGVGGVPAVGANAVALNMTALNGTGNGNLRVFSSDAATPPLASNLNFTTGAKVQNLVIVKVGSDGKVKIHNGSPTSSVDVIADTQGAFRVAD